jgi:hypothetical protein
MFRFLPAIAVVATLFCIVASGQTATGIIQGRVTDATGASVPGAKVTIENQRTGFHQVVSSNSEGSFYQSFLIPGEYRVSVEKAGFQKFVTNDVRVDVEQTVDLVATLKVGEITNVVEVSASVAQLSTSSSSVSTVINSKAIMDLPLNGRNPLSLATLTPGVIASGGGAIPWISGGRNATSEVTVDGTSIILPENNVSNSQLAYTPIEDSIEEFTVVTNSLAAEYGRTGGGAINIATRGGNNQFHGSGYDYLRNSKLDTNTWANNRNNVKLAAFQRNQFGGTIGGPIAIPSVYDGRNKTFFFFSEQSQRVRSGTSSNATAPVADWLNGDFSNLKNGSGTPVVIYDPYNVSVDAARSSGTTIIYDRAPLPGNVVPKNRWDPVAANMLKYWPTPNAVPNNQFTFANNFFTAGKAPSRDDKFDSRIDENFSEKFRMYARGSYDHGVSIPFNGYGNIGTSIGDGQNLSDNYNVTVNAFYSFSPTTILSFNYGLGRFAGIRYPFSEGTTPASLGFNKTFSDIAGLANYEFPNISVGGVSNLGQATFTTLLNRPMSHVLRMDLTKVMTRHTVKFGAEFRKLFLNFTQLGQPDGQFSFDSSLTQQVTGASTSTTQGFGFASFLLGTPTSGSVSHTFDASMASAYWGFYVQDDFKVSRSLTLNIGLRYDIDIPRTERYNRLSWFDPNAPSPIAGQVPGFANLKGAMFFASPDHRHQVPTDLNNLGPRIGFAWNFAPKTVFRGAYGILYSGSVLQAAGTSGSSGTEGFQTTTNLINTTDGFKTIAATLSNPFPNGYNLPGGSRNSGTTGNNTELGLGVSDSFFNDNSNPIIQQWSANLQREVKGGFVVEGGYLGSKGNHLIDGEGSGATYNQLPASYLSLGSQLLGSNLVPNPFFGVITNTTSSLRNPTIAYAQLLKPFPQFTSVNAFRKPGANSIYHSFVMRVQKRFSQGLNLLLAYTGGKLIDDSSQVVTFLGAAGNHQDYYNKAAERSISTQDVSRQLVISYNYDLPFGRKGKLFTSAPKALDFVIGGWQTNGIFSYNTGIPLQILNGANGTNLGTSTQRPNNDGKSAKLSGPVSDRVNQYFDITAFSFAPQFALGNTSRTSPDLRAPSKKNIDMSLFKNFRIRERGVVQFRAEAFDATNHPTWNSPGTTVNASSGFGQITSASAQRVMQLALKLSF